MASLFCAALLPASFRQVSAGAEVELDAPQVPDVPEVEPDVLAVRSVPGVRCAAVAPDALQVPDAPVVVPDAPAAHSALGVRSVPAVELDAPRVDSAADDSLPGGSDFAPAGCWVAAGLLPDDFGSAPDDCLAEPMAPDQAEPAVVPDGYSVPVPVRFSAQVHSLPAVRSLVVLDDSPVDLPVAVPADSPVHFPDDSQADSLDDSPVHFPDGCQVDWQPAVPDDFPVGSLPAHFPDGSQADSLDDSPVHFPDGCQVDWHPAVPDDFQAGSLPAHFPDDSSGCPADFQAGFPAGSVDPRQPPWESPLPAFPQVLA